MLGMKIAATGALLVLAAILVSSIIGRMAPSMWVAVPVVASFFGGAASIFVGLILALWG